jgi:hypothetical protein
MKSLSFEKVMFYTGLLFWFLVAYKALAYLLH